MGYSESTNIHGIHADPANTTAVVATGTGATSGEFVLNVPAGGRQFIVQGFAYAVGVAEGSTAQVFKFWRQVTPGVTGTQRAVTFNAGDGTGATSMTIPTTQAIGDVYRVFFGGDTDSDHVIQPGESFAVEVDVVGTGAAAVGSCTVWGYYQDVGTFVDIKGGAETDSQEKPGENTAGKIYNLIA